MNESYNPQQINLDFGRQRKKSFLPEGFTMDEGQEKRVIECLEDDDLYVYLAANIKEFLEKPVTKFVTESKYLGQWNNLGFSGKGVYKYPHGVIYDGYFNRNGEFHGSGILVYPNGQKIEGIWKNGKLSSDCQFVTKGGVVMNETYCRMPDRRFQIELEDKLKPPGQEYLTNAPPPPRAIPEGCYDTGAGFYDPKSHCIFKYNTPLSSSEFDLTNFLIDEDENEGRREKLLSELLEPNEELHVTQDESKEEDSRISATNRIESIPNSYHQNWIIQNCRKAWDEPVGYTPDLYEKWTKGTTRLGITLEGNTEIVSQPQANMLALLEDEKKENGKQQLYSFIQHRDSTTPELLAEMFRKPPVRAPKTTSKLMMDNHFLQSQLSLADFLNENNEINQ